MGRYRYAAAQVADDEVELFIRLSQVLGSLAGYRLMVERMEERLSLKSLESEAGVSRERLHLIHTYRVNEERRDAYGISEFLRDVRSQVRGMLTVRRVLDVMDDSVIDFICA